MDQKSPKAFRRHRSSSTLAIVAVMTLVGFGALAITYSFRGRPHRSFSDSEFNMATVPSVKADSTILIPTASPVTAFSVRGPAVPMLPPPVMAREGSIGVDSAASFTKSVINHRALYRAIRDKYIAQSPIVRQYFQDWDDAPELAKLRSDYEQDHDAIKFAWAAAKSPDFVVLVRRYVDEPDFRNYVLETATSSPPDVVAAWNRLAVRDDTLKQLAAELFHASGLPVSLAQSLGGGKMDLHQAASQVKAALPDSSK